jgi:hypothetical protein
MKRIRKANLIKLEEALDHVNEAIKWMEAVAPIDNDVDTRTVCNITNRYLNKALDCIWNQLLIEENKQ